MSPATTGADTGGSCPDSARTASERPLDVGASTCGLCAKRCFTRAYLLDCDDEAFALAMRRVGPLCLRCDVAFAIRP